MALTVTVTPSGEQLAEPTLWSVRVELRNVGEAPLRLAMAALAGPVSFEVVDKDGRPVPLGPPPTPPGNLAASIRAIAPNEAVTLEYHGDELFPDAPPPGAYRLRFAAFTPAVADAPGGEITSPWVEFAVAH